MAWHPWRELRRRTHIRFRLLDLPDDLQALYARRGERAAILVDRQLPRRERGAALAHELVHDEWGAGVDLLFMPETWGAVVAREETRVDDEVARRLIPAEALLSFCRQRAELGEGVTTTDVAEEFDQAEWVARRALLLLAG